MVNRRHSKRQGSTWFLGVGLGILAGGVALPADAQETRRESDDAYVQRLLDALRKDSSFKVRLQAAVFLGRTQDPRVVDPLAEALGDDSHATVRAAAATSLGTLQEPRGIAHLVRSMALDDSSTVRQEATRALNTFPRSNALPYVVAVFGADEAAVRQATLTYIAQGSPDGAEVALALALADAEAIFEAARSIVMTMPAERRLAFLARASEHRESGVREGAVRVLRSLSNKLATEQILRVYQRDIEVDAVRRAARIALREQRKHLDIHAIVAQASDHHDRHLRARALKLLGVVGGPDAKTALLTALEDDDIYVRGTAVMAMRDLGSQEVIPSLKEVVDDPANQRIAHLVRHTLKHLEEGPGENRRP